MDCNKEEAIRAKDLAEKKMENRDFVSAQKLALKAKKLYPDLENISQMLLVCDVLRSSEKKVYGDENDWYAILNIEVTADEASIRKQYRKFALSLHPDKNKFFGASDAFKLITEAQNVLLDRDKRMLYDTKLKATGRSHANKWTKQQASMQSNIRRQPNYQTSFGNNFAPQFPNQQYQQQHHQFVNNRSTFWTFCPFCSVRYQYYKDVINKMLVCQNCKKNYTAYEMNNPGSTSATSRSHTGFSHWKEATAQDNIGVGSQCAEKSNSKMETERNVGHEKHSDLKTGFTSVGGHGFTPNEESGNMKSKFKEPGQSGRSKSRSGKKRKRVVESSESYDSGSSSDSDEDMILEDGDNVIPKTSGFNSELHPRRSSRPRKHVSYVENLEEDNLLSSLKKSSFSASSHRTEEEVDVRGIKKEAGFFMDAEEDDTKVRGQHSSPGEEHAQNGEKDADKAFEKVEVHEEDENTSSLPSELRFSSTDPEVYEYPDPEFSDFDKDRKEEKFRKGQIWAVYDRLDAMPRYYALITKIFSPGFKVRITWLEPDPDDEEEIKWVRVGLPASCGKFRSGKSDYCEDHPMFSHLVYWEKGSGRGTYKIHPRKGETWALFKDWDIYWLSDREAKKKYAYEFVEVLSDYADGVGIYVAFLAKAKGFACLFCRRTKNSILIPSKEIFRFSHRVPSFKLSGKEREDVPEGSFELDPASLPINSVGIAIPEDLDVAAVEMHSYDSCSESLGNMGKPKAKSGENATQVDTAEEKATLDRNASPAFSMERKAKSEVNASPVNIVKQKVKSVESSSFAGNSAPGQADKKSHLNSNQTISYDVMEDCVDSPASADKSYEVPEPEFYDFDLVKSQDKFRIGQIWAIYSDEDALPKYYGMIRRIDQFPIFRLHVTWLEACLPPKGIINWLNEEMLISCGRFRLTKGKPHTYTGTGSFSHLLRVEHADTKDIYAIFPREGEVWALYRNWNAGMTLSDLRNCKYDIVEVVEENDLRITVLVLELIDGFKSVFRPRMGRQSTISVQISRTKLLRFSHQIPALRLTEEEGGSLRGFWELDTAALPIDFWRQ